MKRFIAITVTLLVALPLAILSQAPTQATSAPKSWTPPRMPDGRADLQGFWTNITLTPLQRPANLANKAKDGSTRANGRDITLADGRKLSVSSPGTGTPEQ